MPAFPHKPTPPRAAASQSFTPDETRVLEMLFKSALVRDASVLLVVARSRPFATAMRKVQVMRRRSVEVSRLRALPASSGETQ